MNAKPQHLVEVSPENIRWTDDLLKAAAKEIGRRGGLKKQANKLAKLKGIS